MRDTRVVAVRARACLVGAAPFLCVLSRDDPGVEIAERFQSDIAGRRPVRVGLLGLFWTRPGQPHPNDRELSLGADLEADAAVPLYRQRTASCRIHGGLVVMTNSSAQQPHTIQHDQWRPPPDHRFHRVLWTMFTRPPGATPNPRTNIISSSSAPGRAGVTAARE